MEAPSFSSFEFTVDRSLQAQLHHHLTHWICTGRLSPGTRLPSSRRLSSELSISRNTVTTVLEQLKSEGFLESIQGKGVYVASDLPKGISSPSNISWNKKGALPELSDFGQALNKTPLNL